MVIRLSYNIMLSTPRKQIEKNKHCFIFPGDFVIPVMKLTLNSIKAYLKTISMTLNVISNVIDDKNIRYQSVN